jgi:hypothetical protein
VVTVDFTYEDNERVRKIIVDSFDHTESGVSMRLSPMSLYLLNEDDFAISPADFRPETHEHAIPKYEMARIYLILCARTGGALGFAPEDRADPVYAIYEGAYQRCLRYESDADLRRKLYGIGAACGFQDETDSPVSEPAY